MRVIRQGTFETNSSSTHSIAIPHNIETKPEHIVFYLEDYDWSFNEEDAPSYLYTAIMVSTNKDKRDKSLEFIKSVLEEDGIEYSFQTPKYDGCWLENGHIDHIEELTDFLDMVLSNKDLLRRYLYGGNVFTGNDNAKEEECAFVNRNKPTYTEYNYKTKEYIQYDNPYYMGEGYDWFYKGN